MTQDDLLYIIGKLTVEREMLAARLAQLEARVRDLENDLASLSSPKAIKQDVEKK